MMIGLDRNLKEEPYSASVTWLVVQESIPFVIIQAPSMPAALISPFRKALASFGCKLNKRDGELYDPCNRYLTDS